MHLLNYLLVPTVVSALAVNKRTNYDIPSPRALYMLDSSPSGSTINAFSINEEDGSLSNHVVTSTGELGQMGLLIDLVDPNGPPAVAAVDPLASQNSIIVYQNYLFNVNAGSNSVSMFIIDPTSPTTPTLINSAPSLGYFPNTVAYSPELKTACVANGGLIAGIACYSVDRAKGLTPITELFTLPITNKSPPVIPWNTTSDIQFSPNNDFLLVTIKGTEFSPSETGYGMNVIFPIVDGKVVNAPVINRTPDMHINFGFSWVGDYKAIISDFPLYIIANIDPTNFTLTVEKNIIVPGAIGLCWTRYSTRFDTIFISDGLGVPNITLVDPASGEIKGAMKQNADGLLGTDIAIDRHYFYNLRGNNNITVSNLTGLNSKGKANVSFDHAEFQNFVVPGDRRGFTGLAVFPSS